MTDVEASGAGERPLKFLLIFTAVLSILDLLAMLPLMVAHAYTPSLLVVGILVPMVYLLAASSGLATALAAAYFLTAYPSYRRPVIFIILLTAGIFLAHLYTINSPTTENCYNSDKKVYGCIMDEVYYVPAAQTLLSGTKCEPYADNCNLEHPFLSKAFIAAGIQLFGLSVFGWRFFTVLLGTMSVPVLFAVCLAASRNRTLAYCAALFFAFDTLFFVHSSIAVIDVHAVFFALLGFLVYFASPRFWRFDNYILTGIFLGLSALSKETSLFFLLLILSYHLAFGKGPTKQRIYASSKILISVLLVFVAGIQVYDSLFTASSVHSFLDHVRFMLSYGSSLTGNGWTDTSLGTPITPINWMLYYSPIGYLITNVTVTAGSSSVNYVGIGYYGITNKLETWLTFFWAPYAFNLIRRGRGGERSEASEDFEIAAFALLWFIWCYFPYIALYLVGRVTYPYYMIQAVPAIAIGCAYIVTREWFPRIMVVVFLAAVLGWFLLYYPNKDFLPVWLRVMLGR